jgi:hypothetical protein
MASQAETQAPSDFEEDDAIRVTPGALLTPIRAAAATPAAAAAPPPAPRKKKLDFMGGARFMEPPAAAALQQVAEAALPMMHKCAVCDKRLPGHMGKAMFPEDTSIWACNPCLDQQAAEATPNSPPSHDIPRADSRTWVEEGVELSRRLRNLAGDSQVSAPATDEATVERKGKLKRLSESKRKPAPAAAVPTDEEDVEDGVPRRKLEALGAPLPILPASMRLEEFNSIKSKPWRDRIPPCPRCIQAGAHTPRTAFCLGSCGHFIGCIECCSSGEAFIEKTRCPARDCYAIVEFIVVVRNAIN